MYTELETGCSKVLIQLSEQLTLGLIVGMNLDLTSDISACLKHRHYEFLQQNYKALVFIFSLVVTKYNKARNMLECLDFSLCIFNNKNEKKSVLPVKESIHTELPVVFYVTDCLYNQSCSKCLVKRLDLK